MGISWSLVNHDNATYYDLGKGPWEHINSTIVLLYQPELFSDMLHDIWGSFDALDAPSYFDLLSKDLKRFVELPRPHQREEFLKCYHDAGEDIIHLRTLKYRCIGSRYCLGDPNRNQGAIDGENKLSNLDIYSFKILTDEEKNDLLASGWNFKNVSSRPTSRYDILKRLQ